MNEADIKEIEVMKGLIIELGIVFTMGVIIFVINPLILRWLGVW